MSTVLVVNPAELNKPIPVRSPVFWGGRIAFGGVVNCFYVRDVLLHFRILHKNHGTTNPIILDWWSAQDNYYGISILIGNKVTREYSLTYGHWMRHPRDRVYSVVSTAVVSEITYNAPSLHGGYTSATISGLERNTTDHGYRSGAGVNLCFVYKNKLNSNGNFIGVCHIQSPLDKYFGYLYYTNSYGAFEFFPVFCIAKKFRDKKGGRRPELFEIENTDTQEVVWELGIPMESLQRSISVISEEKNPIYLFQYFNELLRSYVIYFAPPGHTDITQSMSHWHRVAITSKNVQPDIHKTYVKVEVTAISEVLCPTIKPNAYDE